MVGSLRYSNGVVDFSELASGLSILCGGQSDTRVRSAFALFDFNGDGFISLEEMTRYMASVFKVLYEIAPGTADRMGGLGPEDLAEVTTAACFEQADLTHDGRLSFQEFTRWYQNSNAPAAAPRAAGGGTVAMTSRSPRPAGGSGRTRLRWCPAYSAIA